MVNMYKSDMIFCVTIKNQKVISAEKLMILNSSNKYTDDKKIKSLIKYNMDNTQIEDGNYHIYINLQDSLFKLVDTVFIGFNALNINDSNKNNFKNNKNYEKVISKKTPVSIMDIKKILNIVIEKDIRLAHRYIVNLSVQDKIALLGNNYNSKIDKYESFIYNFKIYIESSYNDIISKIVQNGYFINDVRYDKPIFISYEDIESISYDIYSQESYYNILNNIIENKLYDLFLHENLKDALTTR